MPNDDIMTVKELADYLKIAEKTAYRFASEGKVPGFKVGSAWRFRRSEIDRWISEQEQNKDPNPQLDYRQHFKGLWIPLSSVIAEQDSRYRREV